MSASHDEDLLGQALAACVGQHPGLGLVLLPEGVSKDVVSSLVRAANRARIVPPAYALVVRDGPDDLTADPLCPEVSPDMVIAWRQDARLAVAVGNPPAQESFRQVFSTILGAGYPDASAVGPPLRALADAALRICAEAAGLDQLSGWNRLLVAGHLDACVSQLRDAYAAEGRKRTPWNVAWFVHVQRGLTRLCDAYRGVGARAASPDLTETLLCAVFPAFGLPAPAGAAQGKGLRPSARSAGAEIVQALEAYWADADAAESNSAALAHHPEWLVAVAGGGGPHPMAGIGWSQLDTLAARRGTVIGAFAECLRIDPAGEWALANLTEHQFFNPCNLGARSHGSLEIETQSGASLGVTESASAPSFIVLDPTTHHSDVVSVVIPTHAVLVGTEVARSQLTVRFAGKSLSWEQEDLIVDSSGRLVATGRVRLSGPKPPVKPVRLAVSIESGDPLQSAVPNAAAASVYVPPVAPSGLVWFTGPSGRWQGVEAIADGTAENPRSVDLGAASSPRVLVIWQQTPSPPPSVDGEPLERWVVGGMQLARAVRTPTSGATLTVGRTEIELKLSEAESGAVSPVIAAIKSAQLSKRELSAETRSSIRGAYEDWLAAAREAGGWRASLGHIVLPANDSTVALGSLTSKHGEALLIPESASSAWDAREGDFRVPESLVSSPEADAFRDSVFAVMAAGADVGFDVADVDRLWPSQASWRELWLDGAPLLTVYLEAYRALMERAAGTGEPGAVFWAAYPFTVSVWELHNAFRCKAVLLSPMHPVRLAWLAGAESTLWDSPNDMAAALAGTIEGWNLPLLGPNEDGQGAMLAIPADNGDGQVFLGWSLMTEVDHRPATIEVPPHAGRYRMPGSASSGLNQSAVTAAIGDYRRLNPHVSTLTIDLAAPVEAVRLREIDEAILGSLSALTGRVAGGGGLSGLAGLRVRDSLNRIGEPPRDEIAKAMSGLTRTPVSWARYQHDDARTQAASIRFLQDSHIQASVRAKANGEPAGVIGSVPLRRLEAADAVVDNATVTTYPGIDVRFGWRPLVMALACLEGADPPLELRVSLTQSLLVDARSDWTVSGEALLTPGALSQLIARHGGRASQMLWEWRPPFLDVSGKEAARGEAVLERRPYVSVVRVPPGLRAHLG
jgi:DNA phosphorothioation-dependent restriction protein DptH